MAENQLAQPSLSWRIRSQFVMGMTGVLSRWFIYGLNQTEIYGLEPFLKILDERKDIARRERGLITVSNHISVLDDPLIWGCLPYSYMVPDNLRWGLGSHDICFKNKVLKSIFEPGQVLPTHRLAHSPFGGLFQPTMTQAIRLLSRGPFTSPEPPTSLPSPSPTPVSSLSADREKHLAFNDPFSSNQFTFSTNGEDSFHAPSAYANRRHGWIHIFPEGKVHQRTDKTMRYFKWGVARLILESDPCPDVVPMWVEGFDSIMHESREFPRFIPRTGKPVRIAFGEKVDMEEKFGDLKERWRQLREKETENAGNGQLLPMGVLSDELKYGEEAVALRRECTSRVRAEVLRVRQQRGLPDEDPKSGLVETWRAEGPKLEGHMEDDSWIRDV
ncbi:hypothetical protein L228DRAFT_283790 [Xylona heveae TC161]|uniref:Tafazzin family protein n=1 Tax=Xylona heveae (strain CBS 132557 / TC161) TaxID=1328760 RepID=A0A165G210_XYLHT|nr:hypothetical protein L228DRAFT_283790 [Xylona heveae TC161]KZF21647.1 hypothetical protein L228DRAFT_283790 [Xylona heveae TC161]